jgi:hypothetical protein
MVGRSETDIPVRSMGRRPGLLADDVRCRGQSRSAIQAEVLPLSLCTCCRHYRAAAGRALRSASTQPFQPSRKGCRAGLRIVLFEACSAFARVTACTLARFTVYRDTLTEGFSHFVTSMTAPLASGWSIAGWDLHPL